MHIEDSIVIPPLWHHMPPSRLTTQHLRTSQSLIAERARASGHGDVDRVGSVKDIDQARALDEEAVEPTVHQHNSVTKASDVNSQSLKSIGVGNGYSAVLDLEPVVDAVLAATSTHKPRPPRRRRPSR